MNYRGWLKILIIFQLKNLTEEIGHILSWVKEDRLWDVSGVHWLRLHASNVGDVGLIPSGGSKIPHATWCGQKIF